MSSKKLGFLWLLTLATSFIVGYSIASKNFQSSKTDDSDEIIRKNFNYKFINPILECNSDISLNNNLTSLKKSVQQIIDKEISKKDINFASVYFRDLNNGPWFSINASEYFSPASLIKVPVLMAYLKKAESDPSILQQKIVNIIDPNSGTNVQNIKPSTTIQPNQEYTIEELLNRMIINSDNDAYNDLANNLDQNELFQIYQDLDVDISKAFTNPNGNIITVKDYASFYRILFNASYLNQDMSEKALKLLSQSEYKEALVAGVPSTIAVAHKFGERKYLDTNETQLHDCGIIYAPNKPYLLCVMTRGSDITKANTTIKQISQQIYQTMINNQ